MTAVRHIRAGALPAPLVQGKYADSERGALEALSDSANERAAISAWALQQMAREPADDRISVRQQLEDVPDSTPPLVRTLAGYVVLIALIGFAVFFLKG